MESCFFLAESCVNGIGLWRTVVNGVENEAKRIKTIDGADATGLKVIYRSQNFVIFRATRYLQGLPSYSEADTSPTLWRTDGTSEGTYRLDPNVFEGTGTHFNYVSQSTFLAGSDRLYYTSLNSLYRFNILTEKSTLIKTFQFDEKDRFVNSINFNLSIIGDASGSQFYVQFGDSFYLPKQLWISDGTTGGTSMLQSNIIVVGAFKGKLIVCESGGSDVFVIDQFRSEKIFTVNRNSNRCSNTIEWSDLAYIEDRYIFTINDDSYNFFSTDLTPEGSFGLVPAGVRAKKLGVVNSKLIYADSDNGIFSTDGSAKGAEKIATENAFFLNRLFSTVGDFYSRPIIEPQHGFQIFETTNEGDKRELWKTDGTSKGAMKSKKNPRRHSPKYIGSEGVRHFFSLTDYDDRAFENSVIWHSDGTEEGTYKLSYLIDDQPVSTPLRTDEKVFIPAIQLLLDDERQ